jgi:hypothetical protein
MDFERMLKADRNLWLNAEAVLENLFTFPLIFQVFTTSTVCRLFVLCKEVQNAIVDLGCPFLPAIDFLKPFEYNYTLRRST